MSKKHIIMGTFAALILLAPSFAIAQQQPTLGELQAQINNLLQIITDLQTQLTDRAEEENTQEWCYNFNKDLRYGDSGEEVNALQMALEKEGFSVGATKGYFGTITASIVTGFQQKYESEILTPVGLKYGTGFVGSSTRTKLNTTYGCGVEKMVLTTPSTPENRSVVIIPSVVSPAIPAEPVELELEEEDNQQINDETAPVQQTDLDVLRSCFLATGGLGNCKKADLNEDGVVNPLDLALFKKATISHDLNNDGIINWDGVPSFQKTDLDVLRACFLATGGLGNCKKVDLNEDGVVNPSDLFLFKQATVLYDLNNDGVINWDETAPVQQTDLGTLRSCFLATGGLGNCKKADLNEDGVVNPLDLALFKKATISHDLNNDGVIDWDGVNTDQQTDLDVIRTCYLKTTGGLENCEKADFNKDGIVNPLDLGLFKQATISHDLNNDGVINWD